jgi:DNA invertase Pin-like site-specific DNA recombinase
MAQTNERRKNMATTSDPTPEPPTPSVSTPAFRAAQYVRMSTEHQQYSTHNQADKMLEYAERRNIQIVRTYADEGKSGLSIDGRASLQRLIADVESGHTDFNLILVYDVNRWGRFQDADEFGAPRIHLQAQRHLGGLRRGAV